MNGIGKQILNNQFKKHNPMIKLTSLLATIFILCLTTPDKPKEILTSEQQEKTVVIKLTVAQINIVLKGVSGLPISEAQDTYMTILIQAQQQLQQDSVKKK